MNRNKSILASTDIKYVLNLCERYYKWHVLPFTSKNQRIGTTGIMYIMFPQFPSSAIVA